MHVMSLPWSNGINSHLPSDNVKCIDLFFLLMIQNNPAWFGIAACLVDSFPT